MKLARRILTIAALLVATPAFAQGAPGSAPTPDTMQVLREKLKADKKLLVASAMGLTQEEASRFWPVYEQYQRELDRINDRLATTIVAYAREYNAGSLTDEKANRLVEAALAIEEAEVKAKRTLVQRLAAVLPGRKAGRYFQLENKIRALVKYEIAAEVPLAP